MTGAGKESWSEAEGDAAIGWRVRLDSDAATAEDWAALTRWLEASPSHLAAFEAAESLSHSLQAAAPDILAALNRPSAQIIPFRRKIVAPPASKRPAVGAMAAAAAVLAVVAGLVGWQASRGSLEVYKTRPGETRAITLADGSRIRLDAASTLAVRLGWFSRRARLTDGEATFDITHEARRPFEVAAADQRVRVLGTEFNIRDYDGAVDVTVRRGAVAVFQPDRGTAPVAVLTAGWALEHQVGEAGSLRRRVDPADAFAWTQGQLICDGQPLSRIVAYLNRRYQTPIRLSPAAAAKRFSGVLVLGEQAQAVRHLATYELLEVHRTEREYLLD